MAVASEAADPRAIPAQHQAVAVTLDLVNPQRAGRGPPSTAGMVSMKPEGRRKTMGGGPENPLASMVREY